MALTEFSGSYAGAWRGMKYFSLHLLSGRWFMVFATLLIMSVNGSSFMFGLYSGDVKSSLGYNQTTLNLLSFFKDLGGNLGIIAGLTYEIAPPWMVLTIGAILNLFGYLMIWLAVTNRVAKPHLWQMSLYFFIGANSQSFPNTGTLVTCVKNFPETRGSVIGLLKGFIGLSGAIMTQFYHALYGDNSKAVILLIAWLPTAVPLVFLPVIRIMKVVRQGQESGVFYNFLYIALGLAGFMMVIIIIQNKVRFSRAEYAVSASVVLFLLFLPLAVVVKEEFTIYKSKRKALNDLSQFNVEVQDPSPVSQPPSEENLKPLSCVNNIFRPPDRGEDYTILQAIFSIDMLILFIATTCGLGGALTVIDNLGQIGKSLGYPTHSISTFVSLVSIWNFLGRVLAGFTSEILWRVYKFPRPLMLFIVILFSCVGHLLIAFAASNSLYFASVIIGFCLGAQNSLFAIISEIFGLKHYSTLYNVGAISSPVGSYVFNVRVTGRLYDKEALKQMDALGLTRETHHSLTCIGVQCFRMSFVIIAAATLFGCLVSLILVLKTRNFYEGDIYKKFREEVKATENNAAVTAAAIDCN